MVTAAIARPDYLLQERQSRLQMEEYRAFQAYLRTEEGTLAFNLGADAVQMRRVLFPGHGIFWQGRIRKGCECPYKEGSYQAQAWEEGFQHQRWESELTYNTPR